MNNSRRRLGRLYRIRQLEEDLERVAVERAVLMLRQAQAGVEEAMANEREARGRRNAALALNDPPSSRWIEIESEAQMHRVAAVRQARRLPALEEEIDVRREEYLTRRRERQKLEKLLARAAEKERFEQQRRTRAMVDDLFQARHWLEHVRS